MNTQNIIKKCRFCNRLFIPNPKVKRRQYACRRTDCQRIRQKINQISWLQENHDYSKNWYQTYGKAWFQNHPNYQPQYRRHHNAQQKNTLAKRTTNALPSIMVLLRYDKREELTSINLINNVHSTTDKKE